MKWGSESHNEAVSRKLPDSDGLHTNLTSMSWLGGSSASL